MTTVIHGSRRRCLIRDELEFEQLLPGGAARKYVLAKRRPSKTKTPKEAARDKHIALGKFRSLEWKDNECAQAGDWLVAAAAELDLFELDKHGLPTAIAADHKAALDEFVEAEASGTRAPLTRRCD
jgi:hypothetical protein